MRRFLRSTLLTSTAAALLTSTGGSVPHHDAVLLQRTGPIVRASLAMSSAGKRAARRQRKSLHVAADAAKPGSAAARAPELAGHGCTPANAGELARLATEYQKQKQTRRLVALYDGAQTSEVSPSESLTLVVRSLLKLSRATINRRRS